MTTKLRSLIISIFTGLCAICLVAFGFVVTDRAFADETEPVPPASKWSVEPNIVRWVHGNFDRDINVLFAEPADIANSVVHFSILDETGNGIEVYIPIEGQATPKKVSLDDIAVEYITAADGEDNYYRITDKPGVTGVNEYTEAINTLGVGAYKLKAWVGVITDTDNYFETTSEFYILNANTWERKPSIVSWTYGNFNAELNVLYAQAAHLPEKDPSDAQQPDADITPDQPIVGANQSDRVHFSVLDEAGLSVTVSVNEVSFTLDDIDVQLNSGASDADHYTIVGDAAVGINQLNKGDYILRAWVGEIGNEYGVLTEDVTFSVLRAQNGWVETPNIIRWTYGDFDRDVNLITAKPMYYTSLTDITFGITDADGVAIAGLTDFMLSDSGLVSVQTAEKLGALHAGQYRLTASVPGSDNYAGIENQSIVFNVLQSANDWLTYPAIEAWKSGEFDSEVNMPTATARFGSAVIVITDTETGEDVYFDSAKGIDRLTEMRPASYSFTVTVEGNDDYRSLEKSFIFRVLEADDIIVDGGGLPWWAVLLIVIGALGVVAGVLAILHVKGILQMFTSKMVASIRAKADIDATISAVRAGKITAYAQHTMLQIEASEREQQALLEAENEKNLALAAAQAKEEKKAARRAAALAEKARSPEEKAAALEQKASAMKERAAALKAKAQATEERAASAEARAAKLKNSSGAGVKATADKDMQKAEELEQKAKETEQKAEELKARADIVRDIASARAGKPDAADKPVEPVTDDDQPE